MKYVINRKITFKINGEFIPCKKGEIKTKAFFDMVRNAKYFDIIDDKPKTKEK